MENCNIKQYYYCNDHDDAFFMTTPSKEVDALNLFVDRKCCSSKRTCELRHIGSRIYIDDELMEDTTPDDLWFDRRGGGYCKEYLDDASQIEC